MLEPISPFRLDLTYRRVLPLPAGPIGVAVTQTGRPETPRLRVAVGDAELSRGVKQIVTATLERLLGYHTGTAWPHAMAPLSTKDTPQLTLFPGRKIWPRCPSQSASTRFEPAEGMRDDRVGQVDHRGRLGLGGTGGTAG